MQHATLVVIFTYLFLSLLCDISNVYMNIGGIPLCFLFSFLTCQAHDRLNCSLETLRDHCQWRRLIKMTLTCILTVRVWL
jgi:hypothetical protein